MLNTHVLVCDLYEKIFSIPQAAKLCAVNRSTMLRWVNSGKIKSYNTIGSHKRIRKEDLETWFQENQIKAFSLGADAFLTKPCSRQEIIKQIEGILK